jgi:hypothetical protein
MDPRSTLDIYPRPLSDQSPRIRDRRSRVKHRTGMRRFNPALPSRFGQLGSLLPSGVRAATQCPHSGDLAGEHHSRSQVHQPFLQPMLHEEARIANARDEILPMALSQRIRSTMVCGSAAAFDSSHPMVRATTLSSPGGIITGDARFGAPRHAHLIQSCDSTPRES